MSFVNVQIKGLKEAQKYISKLDVSARKEIKAEMIFAANEVANHIKRDAPVDTARLKNSVSVKQGQGLEVEIVAQNAYAPYMEFGTKSKFKAPQGLEGYAGQFRGKSTMTGDPIVALTGWVKRKGLDIQRKGRSKKADRQRQLAFMIFRKIQRVGVNPQPFFFTNKSNVNRMDQARDLVIKRLTAAFKNIKNG